MKRKITLHYQNAKAVSRNIEADLVIAADGPASKGRDSLLPHVERRYLGYVGWRCTGLEAEISEKAKASFQQVGGPVLCAIKGSSIVTYVSIQPRASHCH